jgi:peptidoglycan/xylan/chitin deacetylase (PgdA/CDA1 family)
VSALRETIAAVPFARQAYRGLVKCSVRSGVPRLWRTLTGRQHVILTFHRVRAVGQPADPFDTCPSVSVEAFRQVLEHVRERYAVVSLRELCDGCVGKAPAAAVTFDDGWRDNYDVAFPILRELGIPATIFVTTGKIGSSELFWQQGLGQMMRAASGCPNGDAASRLRAVLDVRAGQPLTPKLYRDTVLHWKGLTQAERMSRLVSAGGMTPGEKGNWSILPERPEGGYAQNVPVPVFAGPRAFLTADEIREMAGAGIAFGSHTVTHPILPRCSRPEIKRELTESKAVLESLLGTTVDMLAYPDGQHTPEIVDCARAAGYRIGCTTVNRRVNRGDQQLCLSRIDACWEHPANDSFNEHWF